MSCHGCTSVETKESLISENLLGTIKAVLIHELSYKGPSGSLILHSCLHQIDGVHSRGTRCCKRAQAYITNTLIINVWMKLVRKVYTLELVVSVFVSTCRFKTSCKTLTSLWSVICMLSLSQPPNTIQTKTMYEILGFHCWTTQTRNKSKKIYLNWPFTFQFIHPGLGFSFSMLKMPE